MISDSPLSASSSSSFIHPRRKAFTWLTLLTNVLLCYLAWNEYNRIACSHPSLSPSEDSQPIGIAVQPTRRLLSQLNIDNELHASSELAPSLYSSSSRTLLSSPRTLGTLYPAPAATAALQIESDISDDPNFDLSKHEIAWSYCPLEEDAYHTGTRAFCPSTAISEQKWQMGWFGAHVVPGAPVRPFPSFVPCTHLPPTGYKWPSKKNSFPATSTAVHLPNLRITELQELTEFNRATPKNLYHFQAEKYDLDALNELELAEKYIPFANKIRLMLDVGAGGGSLGLLAKSKYDVQTLSTVFADWPYCEYITERGGNCILLDVMQALPMAKFSFDVLHVSWVYHGQNNMELQTMMHELNRILRPGGYMWMRGGWSITQMQFLKFFFESLGYTPLYNEELSKPKEITEKVFFGPKKTLPYGVDWTVIWVKPIAKQLKPGCQPTTPAATNIPKQ